jgi:hypothetical protein
LALFFINDDDGPSDDDDEDEDEDEDDDDPELIDDIAAGFPLTRNSLLSSYSSGNE